MSKHIRGGVTLCESELDHYGTVLFLPPVCRCPCTIHVPEQEGTHTVVVRVFGRQLDERLGLVGVDLRIEVRTLDVDKADLNPRFRARTPVWLVCASLSHGHADDGA